LPKKYMSEITLTLNEIRAHEPCRAGWEKALKALGKTQADDTRVTFAWIVENNGLDDAIWALRCLPEGERWRKRLLARSYALHVAHLWKSEGAMQWLVTGDEKLRAAANAAANAANAAANAAARSWQTTELLRVMSLYYSPEALILELPKKEAQHD